MAFPWLLEVWRRTRGICYTDDELGRVGRAERGREALRLRRNRNAKQQSQGVNAL